MAHNLLRERHEFLGHPFSGLACEARLGAIVRREKSRKKSALQPPFHKCDVTRFNVRRQKVPRFITPAVEIILDSNFLHFSSMAVSAMHGRDAHATGTGALGA